MESIFFLVFVIIAFVRLAVLKISTKHANELLNAGAIEYGKTTTKTLAIVHTLIYFSAFFEGFMRRIKFDVISFIGICLIIFSFIVLFLVIKILGHYWTVKLIFETNHQLVDHWLFLKVKHPNYFLNIIPELLGVIFLFHAYITFAIFVIPYSVCLYLRIQEENSLLQNIRNSNNG